MDALKTGETLQTPAQDKFFIESTLLRIAGALFCHDAKAAAKRTEEFRLTRGDAERHIAIRPDPKLGQPGPLAHKIFVALLKKHSDYGRPIRNEISFTRREIGRLIGRKEWGGRDSEQLVRALHEIHYTFIRTQFKKADGRHVEHSFNIFPEILIERREFASDPIEACTITLAEPIVRSLQEEHFTCLNFGLMQELGTIGQAFYMRAFFHFANLYDGRRRSQLTFQKRYEDICTEWLGGLAVVKHKSKIADRLGSHLDQLVERQFFASYRITKAKDDNGFVITFKPGEAFFRDYDRFYRSRLQGELQWNYTADQRSIAEPLRVAYLFIEKRTGQKIGSQAYVGSKEVETAKQLLAELAFDEMSAFFDYALREAQRTKFDVQSLGGVRQYLAAYRAMRAAKSAAALREAQLRQKQREEDEQTGYEVYRRSEAQRIFEGLPLADREGIDAAARQKAAPFKGAIQDMMIARRRDQIVAEYHSATIKSFDEWKADRYAA
jgi:hypothetical protein